jgi:hypothetical protein
MAGHALVPLVIASQRTRALWRGPMTGTAKQSSSSIKPDRVVAALLAMTI